jgi:O-antigen/teichoic acid export membrane protein
MEIEEHHPLVSKGEHFLSSPIKNIVVAILISIFSYAAGYWVQIILARMLGIKLYGDYAAAAGAITLISVFSMMGVGFGFSKFLPGFIASGDVAGAAGFIRYTGKKVSVINIALFALGVFTFLLIYRLNATHVLSWDKIHPFYLFLWSIPVFTALAWGISFLKATGYGAVSLSMKGILRPVFTLLIFGGLMLFQKTFTLVEAFCISLIASFLTFMVTLIFAHRYTPIRSFLKTAPRYETGWLKTILQLFIFGNAIGYFPTFLIIIMAIFAHNPHGPGMISACVTMTNILWVLSNAVTVIMAPKISATLTKADMEKTHSLFVTSIGVMALLTVPIFIGLCLLGKLWLAHFGEHFTDGAVVLIIIALPTVLNILIAPLQWVMQYSQDLQKLVNMSVIIFIAFLVIAPILTYYWGVMGGAFGFAIAQIALFFCVLWFGIKDYKFLFRI